MKKLILLLSTVLFIIHSKSVKSIIPHIEAKIQTDSEIDQALDNLIRTIAPPHEEKKPMLTVSLVQEHLSTIKALIGRTSRMKKKINHCNELGQTDLGHFTEILYVNYRDMPSELKKQFINLINFFVLHGADINLTTKSFPFSAYQQAQRLDLENQKDSSYIPLAPRMSQWALEYEKSIKKNQLLEGKLSALQQFKSAKPSPSPRIKTK